MIDMFKNLPIDMIIYIIDFIDYEKYCKPIHKKKLEKVLIDIHSMANIFEGSLIPSIAWQGWGNGWPEVWDYDSSYLYDEDI